MELREWCALLAGVEGRDKTKKKADGQDEDTERDGSISPVDEQEGESEDESEEGRRLVGVDGKAMVGGVEHLGEGDEVEEDARRWWQGWRCGASGDGRRAQPGRTASAAMP